MLKRANLTCRDELGQQARDCISTQEAHLPRRNVVDRQPVLLASCASGVAIAKGLFR